MQYALGKKRTSFCWDFISIEDPLEQCLRAQASNASSPGMGLFTTRQGIIETENLFEGGN